MKIGKEEIKEIIITTKDGELLANISDDDIIHRDDIEVSLTLVITCTRDYVDEKKEVSHSFLMPEKR